MDTVQVKHTDTVRDGRTTIYKDKYNRIYYQADGKLYTDWPNPTKSEAYLQSIQIIGLELEIVTEFTN